MASVWSHKQLESRLRLNRAILLLHHGRYKSSKHEIKPTRKYRQTVVWVILIQNSVKQEYPLLPLLFSFTSDSTIRKFQTNHKERKDKEKNH
jgi:hypothetical protein